jgi:hypothetical protein
VQYETANTNNSYMCAAGTAGDYACGQSEYPAGPNEGAVATIACSTGTISCFEFASMGKVGGSCGGDTFAEDPSGQWAHLPAAVANACVGQQSCTVEAGDGVLNDVAVVWNVTLTGDGSAKFKAVARCTTGAADPADAPAAEVGAVSEVRRGMWTRVTLDSHFSVCLFV